MKFGKLEKVLAATALGAALTLGYGNYSRAESFDNRKVCEEIVVPANGLLQGVIAGIGGLQSGSSFWKSFAKGFVGGALIGIGKCAAGSDINNAWPAKIAVNVGASIANNASNGESMFKKIGMDFGPLYFEHSGEGFKTYILPDSLVYEAYFAGMGAELNLEKTIKLGTPVFETDNVEKLNKMSGIKENIKYSEGKTAGNNILLLKKYDGADFYGGALSKKSGEIAERHENNHALQYASSFPLGNVLLGSNKNAKSLTGKADENHIQLRHAAGELALLIASGNSMENEACRLTEQYCPEHPYALGF